MLLRWRHDALIAVRRRQRSGAINNTHTKKMNSKEKKIPQKKNDDPNSTEKRERERERERERAITLNIM